MASDTSIVSQALLLLRANTISSLSEDSNEAEIADTLYPEYAEYLLGLYPWSFAMKKRQLNQDTTSPISEYEYSHIIPSEALLVWSVYQDTGTIPVRDYDIFGVEGGRRIYSNYPTLYADYTVYTDENNWPPYFRQFAISAVASYLAIPVTGNQSLADQHKRDAFGSLNSNGKGGLFANAAAIDSKQKRNEYLYSSPITEARFS
jgi:hypothetical protein